MFCSSCGTENEAGRKFCDNCAASLASTCPTCGAANRPAARFCGECATVLAVPPTKPDPNTPAPVAERRLVTVLFADLVGFTPFAEERDAEEVRETLARYFELAAEVIGRYGGSVEKFIGDAVMALWGAPTAHEDDAERAVRAGLELVDVVRALGAGIGARAGVLTGEAAVTVGAAGQGMVAGDLVNTASRLQTVASPATVLVGEATMRAASRSIAFEAVGEQLLRGKAAPVSAWRALRVIATRGGHNRSEELEPPFVGRDEELRALKDAIHATGRDRRVRLVSVTGPAGIGKSRLAWELEKYVDGLVEPIYVHSGRSPAYGEGLTFWALGEMVRERAGLAETDDEPTTLARVDDLLGEWVPDEEDRRWIEPALLALLGLAPPPPGGRDVLFAAWRMFFERIAGRGTTVLVFEDLHWADTGLLDFIDHLLEWAKGVPILVLTLARPELFDRRPSWGAATRNFTALALEPLSESAMRDLLTGLVPELPAPAIDTIVERAGGIPLYAVETIRMLVVEDRLERVDGAYRPVGDLSEIAIPETLRSLIASRLDALDHSDRRLLQDASVLGQTFTVAGLAAVAEAPAAVLEPRLLGLVRRELLALEADPRSPERGQYGFVQALVRDVAYGTLARRDRRARHLAVARHLESLGNDELAGALASHYLAAYRASTEGPEADALATQARITLAGAAQRAAALGAHDQAVAVVEQALALRMPPAAQAALLEIATRSAHSAGHHVAAEQLARRSLASREAADDPAATAQATALLASILMDAGQVGAAVPMLEEALVRLSQGGAAEAEAALLTHLSRAYVRSGRLEECLGAAERALALAERLGRDDLFTEALTNKAAGLCNLGRNREAIVLYEGVTRLSRVTGQVDTELRARYNLSSVLSLFDLQKGLAVSREALELAEKVGNRYFVIAFSGAVADQLCDSATDWDGVLQIVEEWLARDLEPVDRLSLEHLGIYILAARGELGPDRLTACEALARGLADPQVSAAQDAVTAEVAWCSGDFEAAVRVGLKAAEHFGFGVLLEALRGALWLRDLPRVRLIVERLETHAESDPLSEALRTAGRAGLAGLEERTSAAVPLYQEAIRRHHELGFEFLAAVTSLDFAWAMGPNVPEARQAAEEARPVFERVRARVYLERLDAALAPRPSDNTVGLSTAADRRTP
jgi:class 3 adenylate cyclase/tetratricopeptide (TPR) repeat protein